MTITDLPPQARGSAPPRCDPLEGVTHPTSQRSLATQVGGAGGGSPSAPTPTQIDRDAQSATGWDVGADGALLAAADVLDDLERTRIAAENRLRSLTGPKGQVPWAPTVDMLAGLVDGLADLERTATRVVEKQVKAHPLGPWVQSTIGVGLKQGGRLIAAIGDPYWHPEGRPRTVSELWALCGYHVINGEAPKRRKGQRANWSPTAKMRAYLVAESCIKQARSPYRPVYDDTRAKHAEATHNAPCARCGPSGNPALEGSPLSAGHQHARAMRAVAKAVLRDMWVAARDLHHTSQ